MLAVLLLSLSLSTAQTDRFSVFITAPTRDGFADTSKDIQDSIKDIRDRLSGMKELQVVDQRAKADIVLTVVTRGVGSQAYGQRTNYSQYYRETDVTTVPIVANTWWVATVMEVGKYRKEFLGASTNTSAYSLGAWADCAKQISNNIKSWALANAEQLRQRRGK
jgi:hypothetical protein